MTASLNPCRMRVPHAVIAGIAAFPNALYALISPRLLGGSSSPDHLIPFGPDIDRLVVGLNVSLDRARVENENSLAGTRSRRVEAVEAIVDLIAHARERGDTEIVEKLTRARMCMEDSLRVPYQSEMDWNDTLTSANSLVDVARLHCNIKLEQD